MSGFTLGELAARLGALLEGDPSRVVTGVAPLDSAGPADLSFVADARRAEQARATRAGALLAPEDAPGLGVATLRCRAPRLALIEVLGLFHPPALPAPGIHPAAVVAAGARVDPSASVGPLAVIEAGALVGARARIGALAFVGPGAVVGDDCHLYPLVVIRDGVRLGRRVIVHPGAVLGADGFGFEFDGAAHRKVPQVGGVLIEDDVEIGANAAIDRATLGVTIVRRGTKIDNLVQIGHNVEVGEHAIIAGQAGVSGSSRLGRGVVLAGQVGVADHVSIGDGAMIGAQAGVPGDLAAGGRYLGSPARPASEALRIFAAETRLPELGRRVAALERRLARLEATAPGGGEEEPDGR